MQLVFMITAQKMKFSIEDFSSKWICQVEDYQSTLKLSSKNHLLLPQLKLF